MKHFIWTDELDAKLRQARIDQRMPWDEVAPFMGVCRELCVRRAKQLNIDTARGAGSEVMLVRRTLRRR